MSELLTIVNLVCAYYCGKWAVAAFNRGSNTEGWFCVVGSAWNAAALMNMIF
jgi:hypothetical protein